MNIKRYKITYNYPDYFIVKSTIKNKELTKLADIAVTSNCPSEELSALVKNRGYTFDIIYDTQEKDIND